MENKIFVGFIGMHDAVLGLRWNMKFLWEGLAWISVSHRNHRPPLRLLLYLALLWYSAAVKGRKFRDGYLQCGWELSAHCLDHPSSFAFLPPSWKPTQSSPARWAFYWLNALLVWTNGQSGRDWKNKPNERGQEDGVGMQGRFLTRYNLVLANFYWNSCASEWFCFNS